MDPAGRVETVVADVGALSVGKDAAGRRISLGRTGPMAAAPDGAVYVAAEQVAKSDAAQGGAGGGVDERWVVLRIGRDGGVAPVMRSSRPGAARAALGLSVHRDGRPLVSDAHCAVWRTAPGSGVAEARLLHHLAGTDEVPDCTGMDARGRHGAAYRNLERSAAPDGGGYQRRRSGVGQHQRHRRAG